MNDFVEKYQSGYKATMLQCWPAQLSQHSSYTTLASHNQITPIEQLVIAPFQEPGYVQPHGDPRHKRHTLF